ncbi:hypothetical protein [Mucilaginibacter sp. FT3.2]|uniref:hypothetical protein n=1 Tax=Mucilaginibacter sp. FT3.2 TaxID=2723090 RepID=UPI00161FBDD9|nr:hypothetical protein [Mucilaginibacter sp. FT3.2]MBB6231261.1 putative coiled-coil protein SlyX [Mucilaginibacter sp. FT3.2]
MTTRLSAVKEPLNSISNPKQADLNLLISQVLDAQLEVNGQQAAVNSLTHKLDNLHASLTIADTNRTTGNNNYNLAHQLVQLAKDLQTNSTTILKEVHNVAVANDKVALEVKALVDKLIYSVQLLNKLSALVIRNKALNPLISDDLITMIGTAGADANNAIALMLIALKSTFAAQATSTESDAATAHVANQANQLLGAIWGKQPRGLAALLYKVHEDNCAKYEFINKAFKLVTDQLNNAQFSLNKAQIKLQSLQSALVALNQQGTVTQ